MKIITPIDNFAETALLIEAGADEFYGGFLPPEWSEQYSLHTSANQRTFASAQITTLDELTAILDLVHSHARTFALTLNAPFYTEDQVTLLSDFVGQMIEHGVDSFILADLVLLRHLKTSFPGIVCHASTLAHLSNAGSLQLFAKQGIDRAVLPRHLTVGEIATIIEKVPDVNCDAFLLVGKCPNTEGLCTFHHVNPDRIWPCEIPYEISPLNHEKSTDFKEVIRHQESWAETDRRHGCGLCAIPELMKAGLHGLKLVGRGAPGPLKARNIALTKEFIALAESERDFTIYREKAVAAHRERFGAACHVNVCYYPEYFEEEGV